MSRAERFPARADRPPLANIRPGWRRDLPWLLLLLAASVVSSFTFACVTPFAAFAVLAAGTLERRAAVAAMVAIWAVNQIIGYGVMYYPWDASSLAWGAMLAVAALAAMAGASWCLDRAARWARLPVAFVAAFAIYETILLLASLVLGDTQNFAPAIVAKLAVSDAAWLLGLAILRHFLVSLRLVPAPRRDFGAPVLS